VKPLRYATDGFHAWTPDEVKQFEAHHPVGTKAWLARASAGRYQSSSMGFPRASRIALSTASGFNGNSVRRAPLASRIAFATADDTPNVPDSPNPLAPNGPLRYSAITRSVASRASCGGCDVRSSRMG